MKKKKALAEAQQQAQPKALDNCNLPEASVVGSSENQDNSITSGKFEEGTYTILEPYNKPELVTALKFDASAALEVDDQTPLSTEERAMLEDCETIIEANLPAFYVLGEALSTIKKGKLYREKHSTFEKYCLARWGFGRAQAYRYIKASDAYAELKSVAHVGDISLPTSERAMRTVANAGDYERQIKLLKMAAEEAQGKVPTIKHYQAAAKKIKAQRECGEESAEAVNEPDGTELDSGTDVPVTPRASASISKPTVEPESLLKLVDDIYEAVELLGTKQGLLNDVAKLRSMLSAYIEQTSTCSPEFQNN